jgi:hypothetical protein
MWTRQSPLWFWGALIALFAIALVTGAIVLAARDDNKKGSAQGPTTSTLSAPSFTVSTGVLPTTAIGPTTLDTNTDVTIPPTTTSTPTFSSTLTTTTAPTTTAPTTTASGNGLTTWPSGKSGYTVILESLASKSAADSKAQQAKADGLPEVGVLNSSNYSSLNPGFYVVFSGVYDTLSEANSALPAAKSAGWSAAYVRQITP